MNIWSFRGFAGLLPILVAGILVGTGCSSVNNNLVRTQPGYGFVTSSQRVIGDTIDAELLSSLVLDYVNLFRARYALSRYNPEPRAMTCAKWMAGYQSSHSVVTHEAEDIPAMEIFPKRYRAVGGESYARGVENAGWYRLYNADSSRNYTYDEMARVIVDGWINSPGHRKNLLAQQDDEDALAGLGIARGSYEGVQGIYSTMNAFFPWPDDPVVSRRHKPMYGG